MMFPGATTLPRVVQSCMLSANASLALAENKKSPS
jgi:hypothetical protein